ncbi:hypothetical protein ACFROC_35820 [Nocardia tengchongensis]|uniref:hypothetical protein n=1 Tax=Nocardia tengchongensis TaxID=2055889 RepID=UPI0036AE5B3B
MRSNSPGRVLGAGMAGLAVASATAVAVVMAPAANATVDNITISDSAPTVGSTYSLHADLSGASFGLLVYWNDNGTALTPAGKMPWPPYNASLDWTPTTPGQHVITASQGSSTQTLIVNVAGGTTTPPTTTSPATTTPTTTAPTTTKPSTGSGGSGSATGSAGTLVSSLLRGLLGSS